MHIGCYKQEQKADNKTCVYLHTTINITIWDRMHSHAFYTAGELNALHSRHSCTQLRDGGKSRELTNLLAAR